MKPVFCCQIETLYGGDQARYVVLVGEDNYYNDYEVAVRAINDEGAGPLSPAVTIKSAMGCEWRVYVLISIMFVILQYW